MILRTIRCSICDEQYTETEPNVGFPSWGALQGVALNGEQNPTLCPRHLAMVAKYIDKEITDGVD